MVEKDHDAPVIEGLGTVVDNVSFPTSQDFRIVKGLQRIDCLESLPLEPARRQERRLADEGSKSRHKAFRLPKGCLASLGLVAIGNSIGYRKKIRAPCGADRKCGWAGCTARW
jgi:hypothetical protein